MSEMHNNTIMEISLDALKFGRFDLLSKAQKSIRQRRNELTLQAYHVDKSLRTYQNRLNPAPPSERVFSQLGDLSRDKHLQRIYLAGAISSNGWRERLIGHQRFLHEEKARSPSTVLKCWGPLGLNFLCVGPFFVSCDHGCGHSGPAAHGLAYFCESPLHAPNPSEELARRNLVHWLNVQRIERARGMFVYIDEGDCFGTLIEIGHAYGRQIPIGLAFGPSILADLKSDMWLADRYATWVYDLPLEKAFIKFFVDLLQWPGMAKR